MLARTRKTVEIARQREELAYELCTTKGMTEREIAEEIGRRGLGPVSQPAVSKMLRRVEARALAAQAERVASYKIRQTESLERAFAKAMACFEASKGTKIDRTEKVDADGAIKEVVTVERTSCGDPRFLAEARQALADVRQIWGLNAPAQTKASITGRLGLEIVEEIVDVQETAPSSAPLPTTEPTTE